MSQLDPDFKDFKPHKIGSDHLSDPELHKVVNKSQLADYYGWDLNQLRSELESIQPNLDFDVLNKRKFTTGKIMRIADQLGVPNNWYARKSS